jgi:hypothetical protein
MSAITKAEYDAASKALTLIHGRAQAIGAIGVMLRRCKPGSARHQELVANLTRLTNEAYEMTDTVRFALYLAAK